MKPFRTYTNDEGDEEDFVVFIAHGHSRDWQKVNRYIRNTLHFKTVVSVNHFGGGIILQKIKNAIWHQCDCAVAILSPDVKLQNGEKHARPNVIFEMGYCMGFWDHYYWRDEKLEPVILLKEQAVQVNSDLDGFELIHFTDGNITKAWDNLKTGLNAIYDYLNNGKKLSIVSKNQKSLAEMKNDLKMIITYLADKGWSCISCRTLKENVHPKFTESYIMHLLEKFPNKMRQYKLKNERKGIKLINKAHGE